jgi:hypothetical protein
VIATGNHVLPPEAAGRYVIPLLLGGLGLLTAWGDVRYMQRPRPTPMAWWYKSSGLAPP